MSAEAGYYSVKAVDELYFLGVRPPHPAGEDPPRPGVPWPLLKELSVRVRMRRKVWAERRHKRYALRMGSGIFKRQPACAFPHQV